MADFVSRVWLFRAGFFLLAGVAGFVQLLPLDIGPDDWVPGQELVLVMAFAWVVRRPEYVPALLLAAVFLIADILFMRPPGLWAALVVLAGEFLRGRRARAIAATLFTEWLLIAAVVLVMKVVETSMLLLSGSGHAGMDVTIIHLGFAILFYPVVVLLSERVLGIRKLHPGDRKRS
ncbi:MAG: rod shape-determining protein MreD [Boseongicola sp.]|nr:rod shape-determining protein MreD [Boseongicola sp.]